MRVKVKLVHGVGTNDADYFVQPIINGKRVMCPYYRSWKGMLERCYSERELKRYPTYWGCSVCKEWLTFSNFKSWMGRQDWEGKELDKDLISDEKIYSPETCCFVEPWLNKLFLDRGRDRGKWPLGVCYHKQHQKFIANLRINGKTKHLGYFETPKAAHAVYLKAKREYVIEKMKDYPNAKIKQAVLAKV